MSRERIVCPGHLIGLLASIGLGAWGYDANVGFDPEQGACIWCGMIMLAAAVLAGVIVLDILIRAVRFHRERR